MSLTTASIQFWTDSCRIHMREGDLSSAISDILLVQALVRAATIMVDRSGIEVLR